jgi:hypothetical protein
MNHAMETADRDAHVRIVSAGVTLAIVVAWIAIAIAG